MRIFFTFLAVGSFLLLPLAVLAADTDPCQGKTGLNAAGCNLGKSAEGTGLKERNDVGAIVSTVIKAAVSLVGTIFFVLTIYAGYLWMTAYGEESKIESAKKILKASIIGLVITLSAYAITAFVSSKLIGGASGGGAGGGGGGGGTAGGGGYLTCCYICSVGGTIIPHPDWTEEECQVERDRAGGNTRMRFVSDPPSCAAGDITGC